MKTAVACVIVLTILATGCATAPVAAQKYGLQAASGTAAIRTRLKELWSASVDRAVLDIAPAAVTNAAYVATAGDAGAEELNSHLVRVNDSGSVDWSVRFDAVIDAVAARENGDFAAVALRSGSLAVVDREGTVIWERAGHCTPAAVERRGGRIYCFYDRPVEPRPRFEVYDWYGEERGSVKFDRRILAWRVAADGSHVVAGLAGGRIKLLDTAGLKVLKRFDMRGEVIDVAVSGGANPRVAVLYHPSRTVVGPRLKAAVFEESGKLVGAVELESPATAVAISVDGKALTLQGAGPRGQTLAGYRIGEDGKKPRLVRAYAHLLEVSASVEGRVVVRGASDPIVVAAGRYVLALSAEGKLLWERLVAPEDEGVLFSSAVPTGGRDVMFAAYAPAEGITAWRLRAPALEETAKEKAPQPEEAAEPDENP